MVEESKGIETWHIVVLIIGVIAISLMATWVFTLYEDEEVNHLSDTIEDMSNVSSDYYQGWIDCVQELIRFRNTVSNVSMLCD